MIISVVNSKGGVGKTTLSAALAVRAAKDFDRVCLVDLDPQRSLARWWAQRGGHAAGRGQPEILDGVDCAVDAAERVRMTGWDFAFFDGPPAFLLTIQAMTTVSDFLIVPVRPSMLDVLATQDAVALASRSNTPFLCVLNDVGENEKRLVSLTRKTLLNAHVPLADTLVSHRTSHVVGMALGQSGPEANGGRDEIAASQIDNLWKEVRARAPVARAEHV